MKVLSVLFVALLCGCTAGPVAPAKPHNPASAVKPHTWLKGTMVSSDGSQFEFRIQKKFAWGGSATGGVWASNLLTGECLSGQYTAILPRSVRTAHAYSSSGSWATAFGHTQGRNANAVASLTHPQGRIVQIRMEILAGLSPHGIGQGADQDGNTYTVQF